MVDMTFQTWKRFVFVVINLGYIVPQILREYEIVCTDHLREIRSVNVNRLFRKN